ncbi:MAG TPA: cell division protein FtsZ [Chloroflexota bacterium]|nr:cell division protein FtsZ [Chloroflexota bacterium]
MAEQRRFGFDPERLNSLGRQPSGVVSRMLDPQETPEARGFTEIKVVGVGGGGSNTVNRMIEADVRGIDFIAVNSDAQALNHSLATKRLQIGRRLTKGLGSGGKPEIGERSAMESTTEIEREIQGAHMVFVTAGMGGGTGTGAAPIVADIARRQGSLTVGVVTRPFPFEGARRGQSAEEGIKRMKEAVDALIVVPNERLLSLAGRGTTMLQAFRLADDVLHQGIRGIADLVLIPGIINLDFADVYAVMHDAGSALMALGEATGPSRARIAAQAAIDSALLETTIEGAKGVLMNISGGEDLSLAEVHEAAQIVADVVDPDANIIFGTVLNPRLEGQFKITLIATGFDRGYSPRARREHATQAPAPQPPPTRELPNYLDRPRTDPDDLDTPAFLRKRDP